MSSKYTIHIYSKNNFIKELLHQKYDDYNIISYTSAAAPKIKLEHTQNIIIINYHEKFNDIIKNINKFSSVAHIIFLVNSNIYKHEIDGKRITILKSPLSYGDLFRLIEGFGDSLHTLTERLILNAELRLLIKINADSMEEIPLTDKELALILYLLKNNASNNKEDILLKVFGYNSVVNTHTLETHIYRLRQKIGSDVNFIEYSKDGYKLSIN